MHFTKKTETEQDNYCQYEYINLMPEIFGKTSALGVDTLWISDYRSEARVTDQFGILIPFSILANYWVTYSIHFGPCNNCKKKPRVEVYPETFQFSHNSAKELVIDTIDMLGLNFSFLENFNHLEQYND